MYVSLVQIVLKVGASRSRFYWHTACAYLQARRAPGNLYVSVHGADANTFWSMSVWRSEEDMRAFRNSGSHLRAMRVATVLAERIKFHRWQTQTIPLMKDAIEEFQRRERS